MHRGSRYPILIIALASWLTSCGGNTQHGDEHFPKARQNPQHLVELTVIQPDHARIGMQVYWVAGNVHDGAPADPSCTHLGSYQGVPRQVPYDFREPLIQDSAEATVHQQLAIDKYEPGQCGFRLAAIFYQALIGSPKDGDDVLARYKDDQSLPRAARVDLWCKPAACYPASEAQSSFEPPPRLSKAQAEAEAANGAVEPPIFIGPNTQSLIVRLHDLSSAGNDVNTPGN